MKFPSGFHSLPILGTYFELVHSRLHTVNSVRLLRPQCASVHGGPMYQQSRLANFRLSHLAAAALLLTFATWLYTHAFAGPRTTKDYQTPQSPQENENYKPTDYPPPAPTTKPGSSGSSKSAPAPHPIDKLIQQGDEEVKRLLHGQSHSLVEAAQTYRQRRGRNPPPGFDAWFEFAQSHNALVIEEFFDRIHDDLNPFWGLEPSLLRRQAKNFEHVVSVRDGQMSFHSDEDRPWMNLWSDMVQSIGEGLPDVDIPINVMDESRLVVPWETIKSYMTVEAASRKIVSASSAISNFAGLRDLDQDPGEPFDLQWIWEPWFWKLARQGCSPQSPALGITDTDFSTTPPPMGESHPRYSYEGYVSNWTMAKDPCLHPHIQSLHGSFIEPISVSTSQHLFPLFGGSKLPMNNEILLPPAMYWTKDPFYSGGEQHGDEWTKKKNKMIWRGAGTGGRNTEHQWTRFQRHRFVAMINGTAVSVAEKNAEDIPMFRLPQKDQYHLPALESGRLGRWVSTFGDGAFYDLLCFPHDDSGHCFYSDAYYEVKKPIPMKEQYNYKYLPDIDGNSFSGRYRAFLLSTSLPIKATIYNEWHDSRLVPWQHFVPMDNTFIDLYGIMQYFLGDERTEGHDEMANSIALKGKEWAEKVLRREDMQIYVYRLLLEYARLCDDNRDRLGFVKDLIQ